MAETQHIGRKISRVRELRGIKQEALALDLGISQQAVSKLEQSETLEPETLQKVAKALGVTAEAIEKYSDEGVVNYFNTFNDHSSATTVGSNNFSCTFNPLDKVVELYERLLQSEREKIELMKGQK